MEAVVKVEIIEKLIEDFNPTNIYQFGSSLVSEFYRDIDLLVECDSDKVKNREYESKLNDEFDTVLDLTFYPDAKRFFKNLNIANYKELKQEDDGTTESE